MLNSLKNFFAANSKTNRHNHSQKHHGCRLELLEERTLLSAVPLSESEYVDLRAHYSEFNLSEDSADLNVVTLDLAQGDGQAELQAAIAKAGTTTKSDLIVVRTTDTANTIELNDVPLEFYIDSSLYGSVTLVGYGDSMFTLSGTQENLAFVYSGEVCFGGVSFLALEPEGQTFGTENLVVVSEGASVDFARSMYAVRSLSSDSTDKISDSTDALTECSVLTCMAESPSGGSVSTHTYEITVNLSGTKWAYVTGLSEADYNKLQDWSFNGTITSNFIDAEKGNSQNDSSLCWAGAAANMLWYTEWANSSQDFDSEDEVFEYFVDHFTNLQGNPYYGINWFLSGKYAKSGSSDWAQVKQTGGGFYTDVTPSTVCTTYRMDDVSSIEDMVNSLKNEYGIGLTIGNYTSGTRNGGHCVTAWGYVYDTSYSITDTSYYQGLLISDSDNNKYGGASAANNLRNINITWDSTKNLYKTDYSDSKAWYLEWCTALAPYETETPQLSSPAITKTTVNNNTVSVVWSSVTNASQYQLEYKLTSAETWTKSTVTGTSASFTGVAGKTYDVRVKALGSTGWTDSDYESTTVEMPEYTVFALHSNQSAAKVIYLDFTGHTTTGTSWNNTYASTIVTPVYSVDDDDAFNETELSNIQEIWAYTSEYFSAFDVDVTTDENAYNMKNGIRVAIGGLATDWYTTSTSVTGVAYMNSFSWTTDTPAFVFSETYSKKSDPKNYMVAVTIAHEVGHTLGLKHDSTSSAEYYAGANGWTPIMGSGWGPVYQWSKGEYSGATNKEDDLEIITTKNGFGYRTDDYGNTTGTAEELEADSNNEFTVEGIIEQTSDKDYFKVVLEDTNDLTIKLSPAQYNRSLDTKLTLYNSDGEQIATNAPTSSCSSVITQTNLAAGTYYIEVTNDGCGSYYSNYASLGSYVLIGTIGNSLNMTVTTASDTVDATDGVISLREALANAQAGDRIVFSKVLKGKTIQLDSELTITKGVTIDASNLYDSETNTPGIILKAKSGCRHFSISGGTSSAPVTLLGLELTGANNSLAGGVISASGTVILKSCYIHDNVTSKSGGVITDTASATNISFIDCTVTGNQAYSGGVCYLAYSTCKLTITSSLVAGNRANLSGSVFYVNYSCAVVTLLNSVFIGNYSYAYGVGYSYGSIRVTNCTIAGNASTLETGGIYFGQGNYSQIKNSIIAMNTSKNQNIKDDVVFKSAEMVTTENSLIGDETDPGFINLNQIYSSQWSKTCWKDWNYGLKSTSLAIDKGSNTLALDAFGVSSTTALAALKDIQGNSRLQGDTIDIGAVEYVEGAQTDTYNAGDVACLKAFLELSNGSGKNGTKINATSYNADDPSTWTGVTWSNSTANKRVTKIDWAGLGLVGELNLSACTALTYLNCSSNQLTALDVANNTALTELNCSSNQLTALDVANNTALTCLYCYSNQLTTLNLSNNTLLGYLYCWNSGLKFVILPKTAVANKLYILRNSGTSWTFKDSTGKVLDDNYYVTVVPFCAVSEDTGQTIYFTDSITQLTTPTNLVVCGKTNQSVSLSWDPVENASGYTVIYSTTADFANAQTKNGLTTNTVTIDGLSPKTTYYFKVLANGLFNYTDSDYTTAVSATTIANYNKADVDCLKAFLELPNGSGKNGTKINATSYNADDPSTWTGVTWSSVGDVLRVTEINWAGLGLVGELDLSACTALTNLNVGSKYNSENEERYDYNNLTSLNVKGCTVLTELYCDHNQFISLDVTGNTRLVRLSCDSNKLAALDVSNNTELTELYCDYNQLTSLDVTGNTRLVRLSCSSNKLAALDVSNNTELVYLFCNNNKLTTLDVSNNTELVYLICASNPLTTLDVSNNTNLLLLNCESSQINSLELSSNTELVYLFCSSNQLTSLDVSGNTELQFLSCWNSALAWVKLPQELPKDFVVQMLGSTDSWTFKDSTGNVLASDVSANTWYTVTDVPFIAENQTTGQTIYFGNTIIVDNVGDTFETSNVIDFTNDTFSFTDKLGEGSFGKKDVDIYMFTVDSSDLNRTYTFTTTQPSAGKYVDTYVRLFDSDGKQLACDDDGGSNHYSSLSFIPTVVGTYYLGVSSTSNKDYNPQNTASRTDGDSGDYTLTVTRTEPDKQLKKPMLAIEVSGFDSISVTIGSVANASKYCLEYSTSSKFENALSRELSAGVSTISGLNANTRYFFRVKALASDGYEASDFSTTYSAIIHVLAKPQITSLTANGTTISVLWERVTNATGYQLEYQISGASEWTTLGADSISGTSATFDGTMGSTYNVRVKAIGNDTYFDSYSAIMNIAIESPYNTQDVNYLKDFLEKTTLNGKTNGQKINPNYNADDPSTWTGVTWNKEADGKYHVKKLCWKSEGLEGTLDSDYLQGLNYYDCNGNKKSAECKKVISLDSAKNRSNETASNNVAILNEWSTFDVELWSDFAADEEVTITWNAKLFSLDLDSSWRHEGIKITPKEEDSTAGGDTGEDGLTTRTFVLTTEAGYTANVGETLVATFNFKPVKDESNQSKGGLAQGESLDSAITVNGTTIQTKVYSVAYDIDDSGAVDIDDLVAFAKLYYTKRETNENSWKADFDSDGDVDIDDLVLFAKNYNLNSTSGNNVIFDKTYNPQSSEQSSGGQATPTLADCAWQDFWAEMEEEENERLAKQQKNVEFN